MKQEEYVEIIRRRREEIPNYYVYGLMRSMGIKRLQAKTVDLAKTCIAIQEMGMPITMAMVKAVEEKEGLIQRLHTLGDKNFLEFVPGRRKHLQWRITPEFMSRYRG
jgi:hypothetical protein